MKTLMTALLTCILLPGVVQAGQDPQSWNAIHGNPSMVKHVKAVESTKVVESSKTVEASKADTPCKAETKNKTSKQAKRWDGHKWRHV